jgi:RNA polymerase sigma factor (sigma-70 family)
MMFLSPSTRRRERREAPIILMPPQQMDKLFEAPGRDLDYVLDRREAASVLLSKLRPRQREAVVLFYLTELSLPEICARLGLDTRGAHRLLDRAEKQLRTFASKLYPHLCTNGNGR